MAAWSQVELTRNNDKCADARGVTPLDGLLERTRKGRDGDERVAEADEGDHPEDEVDVGLETGEVGGGAEEDEGDAHDDVAGDREDDGVVGLVHHLVKRYYISE